jgi:hypothetical protein
MKYLFVLLVVLLLSTSASALTTTLKSEYQRGETMLARVDGQIINTLSAGNVEFKRGTVRVPLTFEIKKLGSNYYIWAIAPSAYGNYTMYIYNIMTSGEQAPFTFEQNFTVSQTTSDYTINPGFVTTSGNYEVDITLNKDTATDITYDFPVSRTIHLTPGDNTVIFSVAGTRELHITHLGVYDFPLYLTVGSEPVANDTVENNTVQNNTTEQSRQIFLEITPQKLSRLALIGSFPSYGFALYNKGNETVENIKFVYNTSLLSLGAEDSVDLEANQTYYFNTTFNNPINDTIRETILIETGDSNISIPLFIDVTKNITTVIDTYAEPVSDNNNTNETRRTSFYCSEMSGKICPEGTSCSISLVESKDGKCCLGTCAKVKTSSYSWIGYLIAGIVVLVIAVVWMKYKGVKAPANPVTASIPGVKGP